MPEVLDKWLTSAARLIRVGVPGVVQSYDFTTQRATIAPLIGDQYLDADGANQTELPPVVSNVPVQFPGGGGMILTFPLQAGDTGWLTFADRSIDAWKLQGGSQLPTDARRHSWADALFIPGVDPFNSPRQSADPAVVAIGQDGAAPDFAATANRVLLQFQALADAFNSWTPAPDDGGAALKTLLTTLIGSGWPSAPASSTLKVLG